MNRSVKALLATLTVALCVPAASAEKATPHQFTFGGPGPASLPPGNYLIAAVTDIERGEQFSVPFLTALAAQSIPLTLAAGERKTQDLAIK